MLMLSEFKAFCFIYNFFNIINNLLITFHYFVLTKRSNDPTKGYSQCYKILFTFHIHIIKWEKTDQDHINI